MTTVLLVSSAPPPQDKLPCPWSWQQRQARGWGRPGWCHLAMGLHGRASGTVKLGAEWAALGECAIRQVQHCQGVLPALIVSPSPPLGPPHTVPTSLGAQAAVIQNHFYLWMVPSSSAHSLGSAPQFWNWLGVMLPWALRPAAVLTGVLTCCFLCRPSVHMCACVCTGQCMGEDVCACMCVQCMHVRVCVCRHLC